MGEKREKRGGSRSDGLLLFKRYIPKTKKKRRGPTRRKRTAAVAASKRFAQMQTHSDDDVNEPDDGNHDTGTDSVSGSGAGTHTKGQEDETCETEANKSDTGDVGSGGGAEAASSQKGSQARLSTAVATEMHGPDSDYDAETEVDEEQPAANMITKTLEEPHIENSIVAPPLPPRETEVDAVATEAEVRVADVDENGCQALQKCDPVLPLVFKGLNSVHIRRV